MDTLESAKSTWDEKMNRKASMETESNSESNVSSNLYDRNNPVKRFTTEKFDFTEAPFAMES